jgi:hypothetical protein
MNEMFLHYVWRHRLYSCINLKTTEGEEVSVIHPGFAHHHAGPDFKQAVVRIGNVTWAGDIEIHIHSSDWLKHRHHEDPKYQSIILHVVYQHDVNLYDAEKRYFPTLELFPYIEDTLIERYKNLVFNDLQLPCYNQIKEIDSLHFTSFLSGIAMERMQHRQQHIFSILHQCEENWEETFFRILITSFGFKSNLPAFELLAQHLPYKYIAKHAHVKLQIYALIFGQSGMLDQPCEDEYYTLLHDEYQYLRYKYSLTPIPYKCWNYLRLRPSNFPAVRLAQLSELLYCCPSLFHTILYNERDTGLEQLFHVNPDAYWQTHYIFDKKVKKHSVSLGKNAIESLIINCVAPTLYAYSVFQGDEKLQMRAVSILENIDFEENHITRFYKDAGFLACGAFFSQAILELRNKYCQKKRCLECAIGSYILKKAE